VPRLLKERGIVYYAAGVAGTVVVLYPVLAQLIIWLPFNERFQVISAQPFDAENAWGVFAVIIGTLPVIVAIHWFRQHSTIAALKQQQVQAELDVLRQQINPHFFFNTLNNLYALSLTRSAKTPEVILQLSELMRYVIYEGQKEQVTLGAEVKYMEDYLHLQKIRMHKTVDVQLDHEGYDPSLQISPLLLIILIENAFKHGVEPAENASFLHIKLQTEKDAVYFSCRNSVEPAVNGTAKGIGLENLRRRLQLLYPGIHALYTETDGATFFASLKLQLHAPASPHH
jgi:LytS/YehU family sensor histidine kinase